MKYHFLLLVVLFYSFKTGQTPNDLKMIKLLQDENLLSQELVVRYIGKNCANKYQFKSTGDYIELKNYQIGIIEGENKKEVIKIAMIFKDNIFKKNIKIKTISKNKGKDFFIGNIYTMEDHGCPEIVQIKYEPFRIDTLKIKFDLRMAREKNIIKKSYCN